MRRIIGAIFIALLVALLPVASSVASAQSDNTWWWVCHQKGNGDFVLLVVGEGGANGHQQHGDPLIISANLFPNPPDCDF